jgi:cysteine synthase
MPGFAVGARPGLWLAWGVMRASELGRHDDALGLVGNTPLVRLQRVSPKNGATVWGKVEFKNGGGSVKDRPALAMVLAAEQSGELKPGGKVVEATSGNTGISLAMISALRGYRCILVMPQDMSLERRYLLKAYGAEIELTEAQHGMAGAVARAEAIAKDAAGAFMPRQFSNPNNALAHERTTGPEILAQSPPDLRAFVAGVGTGGTITGVGRVLRRERGDRVRLVAVEPERSPVLSGGKAGLHGIQGLGAGFVPAILERSLLDEVVTISDVAAQRMVQRLAHEEGLLVGPSSGANVLAACQVASRLGSGDVVTVLCDTGERYLF